MYIKTTTAYPYLIYLPGIGVGGGGMAAILPVLNAKQRAQAGHHRQGTEEEKSIQRSSEALHGDGKRGRVFQEQRHRSLLL